MKKKVLIAVAVLLGLVMLYFLVVSKDDIAIALQRKSMESLKLGQPITDIKTENLSDEEKIEYLESMLEPKDFVDAEIQKLEQKYLDENGCIRKNKVNAVMKDICSWAEQQYDQGFVTYISYNPITDDCIYMEFSSGMPYLYAPRVSGFMSGGRDVKIITVEPYADSG